MSPITLVEEFSSPLPAKKLFKAFVLDADTFFPKVMPQAFQSIETLEGDGGVGSIKKITFGEGSHLKYMKHKIEEVDEEKLTYKYTVIEGDALLEKLESISYEIKMESTPDGGCKGSNTSTYYPKPGFEAKEDEIKAGKEKAKAIYKAAEAYLIANPDIYAA
ncbi:major allergen Pru ar 1-like [Malania oleifera]|uniref:major allergen Pru ar 1-like n=1 Tax=Malania oleifera TaxID=397392 RepID=UPI0025AE5D90|nr:major allergen Pru ar 1-like [Malania oleifera]